MLSFLSESDEVAHSLQHHIIALYHVGHIVDDLSDSIDQFKKIYGLTDHNITIVPPISTPDSEILSRFAFFKVAETEFELIQPLAEPYLSLLTKSPSGGGGLNHVAWQVRNLEQAIEGLAKKGIKIGHVTPDGIINLGTKKMAYLDPQTTGGMLIELIELIELG